MTRSDVMPGTVLVCGIARSGLSLTMQMLQAGGYPCLGEPPAFEEYGVGQIPWPKCAGRAVKVVDTQLQFPPAGRYCVLRLRRNFLEQARSFNKWMGALSRMAPSPVSRIAASFRADYEAIDAWAAKQSSVLILAFEDLVCQPKTSAQVLAGKIAEFDGTQLDVEAMAECVLPRPPTCFPGLLELDLLRRYEAETDSNAVRSGG